MCKRTSDVLLIRGVTLGSQYRSVEDFPVLDDTEPHGPERYPPHLKTAGVVTGARGFESHPRRLSKAKAAWVKEFSVFVRTPSAASCCAPGPLETP